VTPQRGVRKYNSEAHEQIVDWVRKGNSRSDAFRLIGVHSQTGHDWCALGRHEPDQHPEYAKLLADIEAAEAEVRAEMVERVVAASKVPKNWTAAMTYLERRDPENWGRRDTTVVEGGEKPLVNVGQIVLVDPEARAISRELLRRVTAASDPVLELEAGDVEIEADLEIEADS
jgi:hypothetical protein